jgi:hypothetical protein
MVTQSCGGGPKRSIAFAIYGAFVARGVEPCHLTDFREDEMVVDIEPEVKAEIANGMNQNWAEDD